MFFCDLDSSVYACVAFLKPGEVVCGPGEVPIISSGLPISQSVVPFSDLWYDAAAVPLHPTIYHTPTAYSPVLCGKPDCGNGPPQTGFLLRGTQHCSVTVLTQNNFPPQAKSCRLFLSIHDLPHFLSDWKMKGRSFVSVVLSLWNEFYCCLNVLS